MLKALILRRISQAERAYGYDMDYLRALLAVDFAAFRHFSKIHTLSEYSRDLPAEAWHAARLAAVLDEDCGPCAQLMITMAEQAGVQGETLRAVVHGDDERLRPDALLAVRFVRAVRARDPAADALREQVVERWGRRALVTLGFVLIGAHAFPTLKYALGYGRACSRLSIAGESVAVRRAASLHVEGLPC